MRRRLNWRSLAPPLTRGSTRLRRGGRGRLRGSPAHAGIDPGDARGERAWKRLPRSRGDRPQAGAIYSRPYRAPPLTRGSTRRVGCAPHERAGSPAHAGIDPAAAVSSFAILRLPRSRGDRPPRRRVASGVVAAPPLTRGSTRRLARLRRLPLGSPAHAGIDPILKKYDNLKKWLPRSRGDRPYVGTTPSGAETAPPLTRGSTRQDINNHNRNRGSPAHAGIDPRAASRATAPAWLPRSRGDRPVSRLLRHSRRRAPPLTRGSTRSGYAKLSAALGSPAHAGIDPAHAARPCSRRRLPRSRGDRPRACSCPCRTKKAPPLTRGSTRFAVRSGRPGAGSPAHAGIDPGRRGPRRRRRWLPRSRGDRP